MRMPPTVDDITTSANVLDIPIASTAVVYTKSFVFGQGEYFALDYKATLASGTVSLKIELEQGNTLPDTEGSADTDWAVAENAQDIEADLSDTNQHLKKLSPVVSKYGRLKITGGASNDAATTLRAKLVRQDEL